ncbi:MAG: diadenylate cyclase [Desulforhopalus sp.]
MIAKSNKKTRPQPSENRESQVLVNHCFDLARQLTITKILVFAESVLDQRYILENKGQEKIILLTKNKARIREEFLPHCSVISLPGQDLSRSDQFQLGLLIAVLYDMVDYDETVLCMTGLVGSLRLDNLLITNLLRDNKWFQKHTYEKIPKKILRSQEFIRLLDIALRLASQGREGKKIGTIFVLGDYRRYDKYLNQLVLNPFEGHPRKNRNIHDNDFFETIREFAALDGAFIVDNDGVVEKVGTYLNPPGNKKAQMLKGFGARHAAAASLTAATEALTIAVSESSSSVVVFYGGSAILRFNHQ